MKLIEAFYFFGMCDDCGHAPIIGKPLKLDLKKLATKTQMSEEDKLYGHELPPLNPEFVDKFIKSRPTIPPPPPNVPIINFEDIPPLFDNAVPLRRKDVIQNEFNNVLYSLIQLSIVDGSEAKVADKEYTVFFSFSRTPPAFVKSFSYHHAAIIPSHPDFIKVVYKLMLVGDDKYICEIKGIRIQKSYTYNKDAGIIYGYISPDDSYHQTRIKRINMLPIECLCHKYSNMAIQDNPHDASSREYTPDPLPIDG